MNAEELDAHSNALLIKIHAMTGWIVPREEVLTILVDQFRKKIIESYSNITVTEIEYAFREYGAEIKEWGKQLNLSLIDQVIDLYLERRRSISMIEESKKKTEQVILTAEQLEDVSRGNAEQWFQWMLFGRLKYVPIDMKTILVKDGYLYEEDDITAWIVKEIGKGRKNLYVK